jgi:hypothetical protein
MRRKAHYTHVTVVPDAAGELVTRGERVAVVGAVRSVLALDRLREGSVLAAYYS